MIGTSRGRRDVEQDDSQAVGSHLLEQILRATAGDTPSKGFVESADARALEAVAQKLAGRPFDLEPVAVELVHAMLEVQFTKAGMPVDTLRAMAQQIATTLYDDPTSRQRLEALWLELSGK